MKSKILLFVFLLLNASIAKADRRFIKYVLTEKRATELVLQYIENGGHRGSSFWAEPRIPIIKNGDHQSTATMKYGEPFIGIGIELERDWYPGERHEWFLVSLSWKVEPWIESGTTVCWGTTTPSAWTRPDPFQEIRPNIVFDTKPTLDFNGSMHYFGD